MNAAHERAETLRRQGGTLRADQDTASTLALKTAIQSNGVHLTISSPTVAQLNQGIVQAKVQYSYAQARGDQSAMAAAHALAENYRAMGGTISASASLVDAQRQAASLSSNINHSSTASVTQETVQARIDYATAHAMVGTPGDNATVAQARANWTNTVSKPQLEKLSNEIDNSDGSDTVTVFYHPQDGSSVIDNGKNATVVIPPSHPDVDLQNSLVEDDKLAYINASARGDQQVMQQKSNDANYHRDLGATLDSGDDTAATQDLKNYYSNDPYVLAALKSHSKDDLNKAIWKAKNDFAYAQKTHDEAGMKAAAAMAENMRMMGGTIGSEETLGEAHNLAFGYNPPQDLEPNGNCHEDELGEDILIGVLTGGAGLVKSGVKIAIQQIVKAVTKDVAENVAKDAAGSAAKTVTEDVGKTASEGTANLTETEQSITTKLDQYLLNPDHPVGGSKANWFQQALGFNKDNMGELAKQIKFDPSTAVETGVTQYGTKYNQVINIVGANGRHIDIAFAWIKNNDGIVRLVTAIPTKK